MITINDLTKTFGAFTAVDRLSLEIKDGEIFGFLGSNGTGKSTTLKMITGILPPTSGDIEVSGYSITKDHINAKKNIGFVPDSPNVFLRLKVWSYCPFGIVYLI